VLEVLIIVEDVLKVSAIVVYFLEEIFVDIPVFFFNFFETDVFEELNLDKREIERKIFFFVVIFEVFLFDFCVLLFLGVINTLFNN
jgi:hypothetical protein